jgi:hypothetical protein
MARVWKSAARENGRPRKERAWLKAILMLVVSWAAFVLVPNQMLTYLSLHAAPRVRDLLVMLWCAVAFVACTWLFIRLQRTRKTVG